MLAVLGGAALLAVRACDVPAQTFVLEGPQSNEVTTVTTGPTVVIAWDANPEPNVVGYKVYVGTAPRTYSQVWDVGNVTQHTVTGLTVGVSYYFSVTAYSRNLPVPGRVRVK